MKYLILCLAACITFLSTPLSAAPVTISMTFKTNTGEVVGSGLYTYDDESPADPSLYPGCPISCTDIVLYGASGTISIFGVNYSIQPDLQFVTGIIPQQYQFRSVPGSTSTGWDWAGNSFPNQLAIIGSSWSFSGLQTTEEGFIEFSEVPAPIAAWMFVSGLGLISLLRRRGV